MTVCSWCFFVVANDCPKLLHGVRQGGLGSTSSRACGLARNFPALGLDDLTLQPTELCDHRKMLLCCYFMSVAIFFFAGLRAALCTEKYSHIVPNGEVQDAPWSVQPNRYVEEETTQVGGLTVCLCKHPHQGERVTGQLSHNTLATAHAYKGTWPTSLKNRSAFAVQRGPLLQTGYCDFECASSL